MALLRSPRRLSAALVLAALLAGACGSGGEGGETVTGGGATTGATRPGPGPDGTDRAVTDVTTGDTAPGGTAVSDLFPGMPPVPDPTNLYSETGPGALSPAVEGHLSRVYVPNEVTGTVTVIDP